MAEPAVTDPVEEGPVLNPDIHRVNITDQDVDNFNDYESVLARPVGISVCTNQPFNIFNSSSRRIMLRIAVAYSDMYEDFGPLEPDGFREIDAGEGLGLFIVDARTDNVLHFVDLEATNCG